MSTHCQITNVSRERAKSALMDKIVVKTWLEEAPKDGEGGK